MKTAIIDVGGGFKAVFGAGVVDRCLEDGIGFDVAIGVSAGTANLSELLSGQKDRTYFFYSNYAFRKEYASADNFLRNRNFVGLDYIYGTLSNSDGEYPLDYDAFSACPTEFVAVACDALTGEPRYFTKADIHRDDYDAFKASSCVPVANQPYMIDGRPYFDGGIADPVPIRYALDELGCDKVVVVLSRPVDMVRNQRKDVMPARVLRHTYPEAAERLLMRYQTYNDEIEEVQRQVEEGRAMILAPTRLFGLDTLRKTHEGLEQMYRHGYGAASAIADFLGESPDGGEGLGR